MLPAAFPNLLANGSQGIAVGMATAIPPHNVAELCDAALYLIDNPKARSAHAAQMRQGSRFPDRRRGRRSAGERSRRPTRPAAARSACARAGSTEDTGRGTYVVVITEIPWLVQKSRLVEKLAELLNDKKLPLVADVRDESAEDIRLVIEPRSRSVDAELMMESLFKLTELENRIPLNMNVLVKGRIPKVVGLAEALREWLDHRRDVLLRRSKHRLAEIEHRLEVLGGYLVAYLNLDKVIKIIRNEDEPKPVLMKTFKLTEVQADAILNMRLRNLRKLEEMEIRAEDKALREERKKLKALIGSPAQQWKTVAGQIKELKETFGPKTDLGKRRTSFGIAPAHDEAAIEEAMVVREPITVVVSDKGWIRALRGHVSDLVERRLQGRRQAEIRLPDRDHRQGADLRLATAASTPSTPRKLPGGRGHGEPVRLFVDLEQDADVVAALAYPGRPQVPGGELRRQRLRGAGGRSARHHAQGQAGAQSEGARQGGGAHRRRRRTGRGDRREPQDGDLQARPGAGDDPRPRRAAAALQREGPLRRHHLQGCRRADLDRCGRPRLHAAAEGIEGLARQSRRCRPAGAQGLSQEQHLP